MTPDSPYKGLASFGDSELDALLFFGRERERETIVANLLASRLTVLYGPSGVGKSSLLAAGVAQGLRRAGAGAVVVHSTWAGNPVESLLDSIRREVPDLGPTAGLEDAVAAAAHARGEAHLLLDQFEDCFRYPEGAAVVDELPRLLDRPGLRLTVLLALRDDALADLDVLTAQLPDAFGNLLRLEALDPHAGREAIVRPLDRFAELTGQRFTAEPDLVDALLEQVGEGDRVETPFLQLVLERVWAEERRAGSDVLRLETLAELGGAAAIVRAHVQGSLESLPREHEDAVARIVRQLVTPSGAKLSHPESDLAALAGVDPGTLRRLVTTLDRERILRSQDGAGGAPRIEIFHDVLAEPLLAWQQGHELERERRNARRDRRRLWTIVGAVLAALVVVTALAVFAFAQRSSARAQARRAHAHELDARALAGLVTDPAASLRTALQAAQLAPDAAAESALRTSLLSLREERVLRPGGAVLTASFSPTADELVAAGRNGALLYAADGRVLARLVGSGATTAAWSPDGRELAVGGENHVAVIFDAAGRTLRTVQTAAPIAALSYAGHVLLAGSGGHVRLVYGTKGPIRTLSFPGAVVAAALTPDRRFVAVAAKRSGRVTTYLIDVATRRIRATLPERGIEAVAISPDGTLLATGSTDTTARLWAVPSGRLLHVLPQRGHVVAVRFSHRGRLLLSSSADGTAAVWDARRGVRDLLLVGSTGGATDATLSPGGTKIAVAFADDDARLYDATDGRLLAPLAGHTAPVTSVGFDRSGRAIVTASDDGTVRLWSTTAGDELVPVDHRSGPVTASFVGDDVIRTVGGGVARFVTVTGKVLRTQPATAPPPPTAVRSPDGSLEATTHGREVDLRDAHSGRILHRLLGNGSVVDDMQFSRDGRLLVTAGADHLARIWDAHSGYLLHVLRGHFFAVRTAEFSPDARWVVTASQFTAGLWDASTGRLLQYLRGHTKPLTGASFSPDGRYIVTGGDDGVASIVRCEICAPLAGLERTARQRLDSIGG